MPTSPYSPTASPPTLGYGQRAEAPIDAVNQWMRTQSWYQSLIKSFGQDPNNVHLNDSQKQAVIKAAQANGVVVDEGHNGQEVDDSGNFKAKSHTLRNIGIAAGIAGAVLATAGLAGAFAPAAASSVAGIEGGAAGLDAGAVAALGTGAMSAVPAAAATTAAGAGALGAGAAFDAAGNFIGPSTVSSVVGAAGTPMLDNILKYGVPTAGNLIGGLVQANAAGKASDAQQRYLEEALAYQKEQDAYNRTTAASRYGDYTKNIAPYVATGSSANARMASLLGLPPNAPLTASAQPVGGGAASMPAATGGTSAPGVTEPGRQYERATTAPAESMVTMQGPDGSQKQVPASQVDHYKQLGATVIGQAA